MAEKTKSRTGPPAAGKSLLPSTVNKTVTASHEQRRPVSLKVLGEYLGLSPATISMVLNNAPGAKVIPESTQVRVVDAAEKFGYRPSFFARALQSRRTFSIGVLVPQLNDDFCAAILEGIEEVLIGKGYIFLVASHRRQNNLIEQYSRLLMERSVEGLILIDTPTKNHGEWTVPVVCIAGHQKVKNVTNITLNQMEAAELGLQHLYSLGHRDIAFMRGSSYSSDSDDRWKCFQAVARRLGLVIHPELSITIPLSVSSPELGYAPARQLLAASKKFTALVAFNDQAAIGAIRAFRECGIRVPEDISILGFDDIKSAAYQNPSLTTIRQPLHEIGKTAVHALLHRITHNEEPAEKEISISPELIIRESAGPAPPPTVSRSRRPVSPR
jgi:DNA-binding LacI/PurR family transcriptional regulator